MSNSVGRADAVGVAVEMFIASGATMALHCGDIGGRHVLEVMSGIDSAFVWGDRDNDRMGLMRYGHSVGVRCFGLMGELDFGTKRIMLIHGDDKKLLRRIIDEQQIDYLICGHELAVENRQVGKTRILNPGALHGGTRPSAMLLDVETGKIKLLTL